MRKRFVLTRILLIPGALLCGSVSVWGQETSAVQEGPAVQGTPAVQELSLSQRAAMVSGRVFGHGPLENSETVAVLLLPGWSETLSADIIAGRSPVVLLDTGRLERVVAAQPSVTAPPREALAFVFQNIP